MKKKVLLKYFTIVAWLLVSGALLKMMPDLGELALDKGQPDIPDSYSVKIAQNYEKSFNNYEQNSTISNLMLVFQSDQPLTDAELDSIQAGVKFLEADQSELKILKITTPFDSDDLKAQMVSSDKMTLLISASIDKSGKTPNDISEIVNKDLKNIAVDHYITGQDFINDANVKTSQEGVHKTELFTILIIFVVLVLVFRSPVTPLVSLITILMTYIASLGVVTQLVDKLNFPYSTMTQSFLLLILFGIGTDYNILLLSRFKEELNHHGKEEAIKITYKTAGKTVCYSAVTVLIGFGILALAKFSVFKAASAVAIAVVILLIELFTLLPAIMYLLGKNIFFLNNKTVQHKDSWLWGKMSRFANRKPIIAIIISLLITVPLAFLYQGNVSYDMLKDSNSSYEAIKGINVIVDAFGEGVAFPVNVYLSNSNAMDNEDSLKVIDQITNNIGNIDGVNKVYSVTRPKAAKIKEFYVSSQGTDISEGIDNAAKGIQTIRDSLSDAESQLGSTTDLSSVDSLVSGTKDIQYNMDQLNKGMQEVKDGIDSGADGAAALSKGIVKLQVSMTQLSQATSKLSDNYTSLYNALSQLQASYTQIAQQAQAIQGGLTKASGYVLALAQSQPQIVTDPSYIALKATINTLSEKFVELNNAFGTANVGFENALTTMKQINSGLSQVISGEDQISSGMNRLQAGADQLQNGLSAGSRGQETILESNQKLSNALNQVIKGQQELSNGLNSATENMSKLKNGLTDCVEGLGQVSDGLSGAKDYMSDLTEDIGAETFYIPKDSIHGSDFTQSMNSYFSKDCTISRFTVFLNVDPYSQEAMDTVSKIEQTIQTTVQNTPLSDSRTGIAGSASMSRDLKSVSGDDLLRAEIIMIIGIAILLLLISGSVKITLSIIAALLLANYAAISATNLVLSKLLGIGELNWAVPFFAFIMIIALGVDYSIFLLMRLKEERLEDKKEAIVNAASKVGGVVISAVVILSGTFAALYPANVLTLTDLATIVIIGLILLVFVLLPIFVPAIISIRIKNKK